MALTLQTETNPGVAQWVEGVGGGTAAIKAAARVATTAAIVDLTGGAPSTESYGRGRRTARGSS